MVTIPTLNAPTITPNNKVDFGTLGDLANTYRSAQAQQLQTKQAAESGDLARRAYAQYLGLGDPGPSSSTSSSGGWLSNLKNFIGIGGGGQQAAAAPPGMVPLQGGAVPVANIVQPTMQSNIQGTVPLPVTRPTFLG